MRAFVFICFSFIWLNSSAQRISNLILVGEKGVTKNPAEAKKFIMVKQYSPEKFERLDYNMFGPMIQLRTYSDTLLKNLNGPFQKYYPSGRIQVRGHYTNNQKDGTWHTFDEEGKNTQTEKFDAGVSVKTEQPIIKQNLPADSLLKEADFDDNSWSKYLTKKLYLKELSEQSKNGGTVKIAFTIDTEGMVSDAFLFQSVEYLLDDECLKVIKDSPKWEPATRNGKPIRSKKVQAFVFSKN